MTELGGEARRVDLDVECKPTDLYPVYFRLLLSRTIRVLILVPLILYGLEGISTGDLSFLPYLAKFPWPQVWGVLFVFFIFVWPYLVSRSFLRKDSFRFVDGHFSIDEGAIRVQRQNSDSTIRWPAVRKVTENPKALIFFLGRYTVFVLPKRSFSSNAQLSVLQGLVRDHVPDRG